MGKPLGKAIIDSRYSANFLFAARELVDKWGSAFSLRTRFPAGPAGRKAGLLPRLAVLTALE